MNRIWAIIKKEFVRFFTDKRLLIATFFPGIVIYIVYTVLGNIMPSIVSTDIPQGSNFIIALRNGPEKYKTSFSKNVKDLGWSVQYNSISYDETEPEQNDKKDEEAKNMIKNNSFDLYLDFAPDFEITLESIKNGNNLTPPAVKVFYNSETTKSSVIYKISLESIYKIPEYNATYYTSTSGDLADKSVIGNKIVSSVLPMIIVALLFSTCVSICPESIAGEKEKNTIGTLLVTPLHRGELAVGKITALTGICSLGAISSFLGVVFSLPSLLTSLTPGITFRLEVYEYFIMFFIILVAVGLIVSIMILLSTFARNTKEANSLISPTLLVFMCLSLTTIFIPDTTNIGYAFVPILNLSSVLEQIIKGTYSPLFVICSVLSTFIYTVIIIGFIIKMFRSEKILFNK